MKLDRAGVVEMFCARFGEALREKEWELQDLQQKTGLSYNRLQNWYSCRHIPEAPQLVLLARALGKSVDWLLGMDNLNQNPKAPAEPSLRIPAAEEEYWAGSQAFVEKANTTIWMQFRVMPTVVRLSPALIKLLRKDSSSVRILISDPDDSCTMEMLARRQYVYAKTPEAVADSIRESIKGFYTLIQLHSLDTDKLDIRTVPFVPSTVMYLKDAETEAAEIFAVTANFGTLPALSPYVIAEKRSHPAAFTAYYEQFNMLWEYGRNTTNRNRT